MRRLRFRSMKQNVPNTVILKKTMGTMTPIIMVLFLLSPPLLPLPGEVCEGVDDGVED